MSWLDPRTWFASRPPAERAITWDQAAAAGLVVGPTTAGVAVSPESALTSSPVFAAVRIISTAVGSLPLAVYRETDDGREKADTGPAYTLLHDRPNSETDACVWWTAFVVQMLLHGKGAAEIEWSNNGSPRALWLIPGNRIDPCRDRNGDLFYAVKMDDGSVAPLLPEDCFYVPYFTLDGIVGQGVIKHAREAIGLNKAMEIGAGAIFSNMVRPGGAIEAPPGLSDKARANIVESIRSQNGGAGKVGRLIFLEDGVKLNPYQVSNQDAQWIEGRQFGIQEVARFFGISPTKLADLGRATWSNLGAENQSFIENTLRAPILVPIEQQARTKLLGPSLHAEYVIEARLRGLTADRYAAYATGIQAGFLLPSEARRMENLPSVPGINDRPRAGVAAAAAPPAAPALPPTEDENGNSNPDDAPAN
ncbi:MAG TPA: phage portal protein [Urbifossiella sp.]|nr:phage portal protein [Urbifossiella sp.]